MTNYDEGCEYPYFKETVAEIFDALKDQIECNLSSKRSKLAHAPLSRKGVTETLSRVYLILIGILSESDRGMKFVESHKLFEFCIGLGRKEISGSTVDRIVGPNDYLLRLLAINLDYSQDQKNLRILFSTLVSTGSQFLRKTLISHLELLYRAQMPGYDQWSIDVLGIMLNKGNQELALTALKVLEKINVSQGNAKARSYLENLVKTKPTDQMVGNYGQFLFAKLLSTSSGLEYLQQLNWVDRKRFEWLSVFNQRYTLMLETALMTAVNKDPQTTAAQFLKAAVTESESNFKQEGKESDTRITEINSSEMADWLPGKKIEFISIVCVCVGKKKQTEEEELYHEYLSNFPWTMSVEILYNTGQEKGLMVECFFDYHCFLPPRQGQKYQKPLGPGIYGVILDNFGKPEPFFVEKNAKVRIRLNIGFGCLDEIHSQTVIEKTVELSDTQRYSDEFTLHVDEPVYFFLEPGPVDKNGKRDPKHSYLSRVFFSVKEEQQSHSLVRPLPHFYGELAKTEKGCEYIDKTDDVNRFFSVVSSAMKNNSSNINSSSSNFLNLRAALWALGLFWSLYMYIYTYMYTYIYLLQKYKEKMDIVKGIAEMALRFPTLSVRGTCLYVLGLFSRTNEGMQQLNTLGFDFPADNAEDQLSIAIPKNLDEFFDISQTDYCKSYALTDFSISCYSPPSLARPMSMKPVDPNELLGERGRAEETILAHVAALCCHVTQKSSLHALLKIHSKKPSVFTNPVLYRECLKLITTYNYNLKVRRFILFQLFDGVMLDNNTIDVFDVDMNAPITGHRDIRQWRYDYKAKVLVKKKQEKKLKESQKNKDKNTEDFAEKNNDDLTD
ncbi:cytosolic regulator Pianissimo [Reticulomyxa filosa]|uniref:Cytosolic regulator Pianissimo n=1 Tax=Reticulomyxa filosa TaxID=46433 RepID=X6NW59_RETFI|nr:cytosolic regulator Pianissimo [Reticulomyxa filosa]|eukprot:ETO30231.1 cytosolic regulator Pianissimo [Reticulomyxa filosa]